jgi:prephenate dehydratase
MTALPLRTFEEVFRCVSSKKAAYGIVPIENSLFGSIHRNYDLLQRSDLRIAGEIKLRIVHALIVNHGVALKDVKYIYSHPQALGQCEAFLRTLKGREVVPDYDTAGAVKRLKEERRADAAAIAGREAAAVYAMKILKSGIESDHQNFTRFLILSRTGIIAARGAKTSIIFSVNNVPGVLYKALSVFALRDIDLYKIESRPMVGRPWEYLFYLDFQGSINDEAPRNAIDHLREIAPYIKILGSYHIGKTIQ